jgi:hypothetical protein
MVMKKRKTLRAILWGLPIVMAVAGFYVYNEFTRKNKDLKKVKPRYELWAAELIRNSGSDEKRFNEKYLGSIMAVTGTVKELTRDAQGFYTLVLGDTATLSTIRCSMDNAHSEELQVIRPGTTASVKGMCTGIISDELLGTDIILNRAVLNSITH